MKILKSRIFVTLLSLNSFTASAALINFEFQGIRDPGQSSIEYRNHTPRGSIQLDTNSYHHYLTHSADRLAYRALSGFDFDISFPNFFDIDLQNPTDLVPVNIQSTISLYDDHDPFRPDYVHDAVHFGSRTYRTGIFGSYRVDIDIKFSLAIESYTVDFIGSPQLSSLDDLTLFENGSLRNGLSSHGNLTITKTIWDATTDEVVESFPNGRSVFRISAGQHISDNTNGSDGGNNGATTTVPTPPTVPLILVGALAMLLYRKRNGDG